jgi:hypothetical protein
LGPPDNDGKNGKRPTSIGQVLGNQSVADWTMATGVVWLVRRYVTRVPKGLSEIMGGDANRFSENDG